MLVLVLVLVLVLDGGAESLVQYLKTMVQNQMSSCERLNRFEPISSIPIHRDCAEHEHRFAEHPDKSGLRSAPLR